MRALFVFLKDIKIEHTLFALPFAYSGAVLAQRGLPPLGKLLWITLAVCGGRTAAMAANRLLDARLDAKNARTAQRAIPAGALQPYVMVCAALAGIAVLGVAALKLNPLCFALVPLGAVALIVYPLVKRWTWGVHFVLGAVDALAPLGAWLAISGRFEAGAWLLFLATALWVAGFDILYALMDREFDVREGLRSIPVKFGERGSETAAQLLHALVISLLVLLGLTVGAHPLYWAGVAAAAALLAYEGTLIRRQRNLSTLNEAVFKANMAFSVVFAAATAASWL